MNSNTNSPVISIVDALIIISEMQGIIWYLPPGNSAIRAVCNNLVPGSFILHSTAQQSLGRWREAWLDIQSNHSHSWTLDGQSSEVAWTDWVGSPTHTTMMATCALELLGKESGSIHGQCRFQIWPAGE